MNFRTILNDNGSLSDAGDPIDVYIGTLHLYIYISMNILYVNHVVSIVGGLVHSIQSIFSAIVGHLAIQMQFIIVHLATVVVVGAIVIPSRK